jgi:hypothetical protein
MSTRFAGRVATLVLSVLVCRTPVCGLTAAPQASNTSTPNLLLKLSNNGRYLVDRKGDPFLVVGDSPWWTADASLSVTYILASGTDERELTVAMGRFAKPVKARWHNPTSRRSVEVEGAPFANRATQSLRAPGDSGTGASDWVLILDAR